MGAGRTQTFDPNGSSPDAATQATSLSFARNLRKNHLGGVIFGCKNSTIKECLFKQLFGLPAQHFSYVKNIDPGLPLFLFNYTDRKLHGIFEAASSGKMNINPYAWTTDGSERTPYPAQVQIHVRLQCHPLAEVRFKPVIIDNYYSQNHFWFELDHAQTSKLLSLLSSLAVAPGAFAPQNSAKWRTLFRPPSSPDWRQEVEGSKPLAVEADCPHFNGSDTLNMACPDEKNHASEDHLDEQKVEQEEKDLVYMKLKALALNCYRSDPQLMGPSVDSAAANNSHLRNNCVQEPETSSNEKDEIIPVHPSDYSSVIAQLVQGVEELKALNMEQLQKMSYMEQKLVDAEAEIQQLKCRYKMLESTILPSEEHVKASLDLDELIHLVGGYDGISWLSAFDSYSPSQDVIRSLKPMNSSRSYMSTAKLNHELYVFGGGDGSSWFDTVESYDLANDQWILRPPLNKKNGSLAGATVNNRIFAMGGGNGDECFANVEMLDLDVGRWISTRSMLQKRFALTAAELNGVLYAIGGFDGKDYLKSAEMFDPREHSWARIKSMNTRRGCHSLAVLNEKIYAIGGFDGSEMVPSVEIYDPRLGSWMTGDPMDQPRGYSAAVVCKESIFVIGGVKGGDKIIDTVECYKEGQGWQVTDLKAVGQRCFFSAIVL